MLGAQGQRRTRVVARHAEPVPDGVIPVGLAGVLGICKAGQLATLHDQKAAVGLGQNAQRLVQTFCKDFPSLGFRRVQADLPAVEGRGNPPVGKRRQGAHLCVHPLWPLDLCNLVERKGLRVLASLEGVRLRWRFCSRQGRCNDCAGGARCGAEAGVSRPAVGRTGVSRSGCRGHWNRGRCNIGVPLGFEKHAELHGLRRWNIKAPTFALGAGGAGPTRLRLRQKAHRSLTLGQPKTHFQPLLPNLHCLKHLLLSDPVVELRDAAVQLVAQKLGLGCGSCLAPLRLGKHQRERLRGPPRRVA